MKHVVGVVVVCCALSLPAAALAAPHFLEVAARVGATHAIQQRMSPNAGGIAFLDYDGDGRQDLLFADDVGTCRLYKNEPASGDPALDEPPFFLREVTGESGVLGVCRGTAVAVIDYDRDGKDDILVAAGDGVRLLHNQGGVFVDRTTVAGLGGEFGAATLSIADFDRDGWPDVYVGLYVTTARFPVHGCGKNRLYRNRGDGTFDEVAAELGADDRGCALATAFVDLRDTGSLDLIVANDFGNTVSPSDVLRWNGVRYDSEGAALGADLRIYAMGIALGDLDGDGWLDFYTTNIGRNVLLRGGPGAFSDATEAMGVGIASIVENERTRFRASWGTVMGDFDLDGALDLYVASGYLSAESTIAAARREPNVLFAGGPAPLAIVPGEGDDQGPSRGVAMGDLDGDGVPDLVVSQLPLSGSDAAPPVPVLYWARPPAGRGALALTLVGTVSEPRAGGARVTLYAGGRTQVRVVDSGGASHGSHHDRTVFFGLGGEPVAARVVVRWPSGARSEHGPFAADTQATLQEPPFLEAPRVVRAGEAASLVAAPLRDDGTPLGAGHAVAFTVTSGALLGTVLDLGDGRYTQSWRAGSDAGSCFVQMSVFGALHPARPRIRVIAGDRTSVAVPDAPLRNGERTTVIVFPRDEDGVPLRAGRTVTLVASGGTTGTTEDLGDGSYRVTFIAPIVGDSVTVRAMVDGELHGEAKTLAVVAPFDPVRSNLEVVYSLTELGVGSRMILRAEPRDGADRRVSELQDVTFTSEAGVLTGPVLTYQQGFTTQTLLVEGEQPALFHTRAAYRGIPFARPGVVRRALDGRVAPPEHLDGARSRVLTFHSAIPADGRSMVRVFLVVRDVNRGALPATAGTVFTATAGTWRGPATAAVGQVASRCLVAPMSPGVVEVSARVSGIELGERARIVFHAPETGAPPVDGCGNDGVDEIPEEAPVLRDGGPSDGGPSDGGARPGDGGVTAGDAGPGIDAGIDAAVPLDGGRFTFTPPDGCALAAPSDSAPYGLAVLFLIAAALVIRRRSSSRG